MHLNKAWFLNFVFLWILFSISVIEEVELQGVRNSCVCAIQ